MIVCFPSWPDPQSQKPKSKGSGEIAVPVAGGNLRLHELRSRIFRNTRFLRVWVPPGYDKGGGTRYPVLYLNDGQNLLEASTAFGGVHWQVGETASRLIAEKKIRRSSSSESTTGKESGARIPSLQVSRSEGAGCARDPYPKFLKREVMPLIEGQYAVLHRPHKYWA